MLKYAICEILGKQYKVIPHQAFNIDLNKEPKKSIEANVLLIVEDGKLKIGKPYLKEKLNLKSLENVNGKKIRVAKFHAKANWRRVRGFRPKFTRVILDVKKAS